MAKMLSHNSNGKPYRGCLCCVISNPEAPKKVRKIYKRLNRRQENVRWKREALKDMRV